MEKTGMIGSCSLDSELVSDQITNIDKIIKRRQIITNVFLTSRWGDCCKLNKNQKLIKSD